MAFLPDAIAKLGKIENEVCDVTCATREELFVDTHTHETTNYGVVTEGTLYLTLKGEEQAYRTGDWFCIPANAEHAERFKEKTSLVVFWLKN